VTLVTVCFGYFLVKYYHYYCAYITIMQAQKEIINNINSFWKRIFICKARFNRRNALSAHTRVNIAFMLFDSRYSVIHGIRYDGITYIIGEQNKRFFLRSSNRLRIASDELQISGRDNCFYFDEDLPDASLIMQLTSFVIRCITSPLVFIIWLSRYIPLSYI